jgi:4-amino-4-deoxy-L-arabinose transferase-like glycosyltransferase
MKLLEKLFKNERLLILIVLIVAVFFSLINKSNHDLQEWDESRNGVNAYEMLKNKDYVNLYYNGAPDTWNAKPPLMIWLIAASHKAFGFNEFALRLPTTLSTILFFILCFYTIKLSEGSLLAFYTCLILFSCKAVFGNHIGLTADFDALLLLFLTASVYTFILYVEKGKKYSIFLTAIFTGLAFYTKGTASLVLVPGFILYIIVTNKTKLLRDSKLWLSVFLFIAISLSWIIIGSKFGKTITTGSFYKSNNALETMFVHDTFRRLLSSDFEYSEHNSRNYLFFTEVIDARLNLWNYLFYLSIGIGIYLIYKNKHQFLNYIRQENYKMILLSCALIMPLSIVLTFATNKNNWYLAPLFMYVAFISVKGILFISKYWKFMSVTVLVLFVFTFSRQVYYLGSLPSTLHNKLGNNQKIKNKIVVVMAWRQQLTQAAGQRDAGAEVLEAAARQLEAHGY